MIIEACVESFDEAIAAAKSGATHLELCSDLHLDGLTPSLDLTLKIIEAIDIPVKVMIRNRSGNFVYSDHDFHVMNRQIKSFKELPIAGYVFGALTANGDLDIKRISKWNQLVGTTPICIHKCIDLVDDKEAALRSLKQFKNVTQVLSSGGEATAMEGKDCLNRMIEVAGEDIQIIAAGKVTRDNLKEHQDLIDGSAFHGRRIV